MITDTTGVQINQLSFDLLTGATSAVMVIRVTGVAGKKLTGTVNSNFTVYVRRNGTTDTFVDISQNPIDTSGFAGTTRDYDLKVTSAASITGGIVRASVTLGLSGNSAANWTT